MWGHLCFLTLFLTLVLSGTIMFMESYSSPESQTCKLLVRGQYFLHTHSGRILSKGAGVRPCVRLSTQDTLLALSYGEDPEAWRASGVQDCTAPEARSWDVNAELCGAVSNSTASSSFSCSSSRIPIHGEAKCGARLPDRR